VCFPHALNHCWHDRACMQLPNIYIQLGANASLLYRQTEDALNARALWGGNVLTTGLLEGSYVCLSFGLRRSTIHWGSNQQDQEVQQNSNQAANHVYHLSNLQLRVQHGRSTVFELQHPQLFQLVHLHSEGGSTATPLLGIGISCDLHNAEVSHHWSYQPFFL
jgi:hypothetical protein